jgi:DNA-binding NtrC family response regulator
LPQNYGVSPNYRQVGELARLEASQSGDNFVGQSKPLRRTTALVVEDEEEQRFLSATLFEESEFDVIECDSAEDAIQVIKEKGEEVALVFTDVQLAGNKDGVDLAKAVREELPSVPVIVTSGAGSERLLELPPGVDFLRKPWRAIDVLIKAEKAREQPPV